MTYSETLYSPPDTEEAWNLWRCNCGPASVAALLGKPCAEVRAAFAGHETRGYSNPTHVVQALTALQIDFRSGCPFRPRRGLLFIQFGGPWLLPGVPIGAAYRHTHWIAVNGETVYDVNAGHWVSRRDWEEPVTGVAAWLMEQDKRRDGTWTVRTGIEVPL